jgi:outer membrane protein OmpU
MNKLTKYGVTALCGSLASIASVVNAGEMGISGGATATWVSNEGNDTGNPLGLATNMTFSGSGELDNGTTFSMSVTHDDKNAFSSSKLNLVTPSMGTFGIDMGAGGQGLDRLDDMMPTAWEETTGTGTGTGMQTVAGVGGSGNVEWAVPTGFLPDGASLHVAFTPTAGQAASNDKATGGDSGGIGSGLDFVAQYSGFMDGLNVFAGFSNIEQDADVGSGPSGDRTQYAAGFTYAFGSVTLGYQETRDNMQQSSAGAASGYDNMAYAVSFNVNDDLSLSYGYHESTKDILGGTNIELEAQSIQAAYTMGGASIKIAETSVDNASYSTVAIKDVDGHTIALSLAF